MSDGHKWYLYDNCFILHDVFEDTIEVYLLFISTNVHVYVQKCQFWLKQNKVTVIKINNYKNYEKK